MKLKTIGTAHQLLPGVNRIIIFPTHVLPKSIFKMINRSTGEMNAAFYTIDFSKGLDTGRLAPDQVSIAFSTTRDDGEYASISLQAFGVNNIRATIREQLKTDAYFLLVNMGHSYDNNSFHVFGDIDAPVKLIEAETDIDNRAPDTQVLTFGCATPYITPRAIITADMLG